MAAQDATPMGKFSAAREASSMAEFAQHFDRLSARAQRLELEAVDHQVRYEEAVAKIAELSRAVESLRCERDTWRAAAEQGR